MVEVAGMWQPLAVPQVAHGLPMDYPYNDIQEGFLIPLSWGGHLSLRNALQNIAEESDTLRELKGT